MLVEAPPLSPQKAGEAGEDVGRQLAFLRRHFTPRSVFMQLGAAECALALQAAGYVERVYAVDPQAGVLRRPRLPSNLRFVFSNGAGIPVDPGTVDIAFSACLAAERLAAVCRCLGRGGHLYFPMDGRRSPAEVRELVLGAGFAALRRPWPFSLLGRSGYLAAVRA